MCGRIRQAREPVEYEEPMNWNPRDLGNLVGGMLDMHDRRPIVLAPDAAREWASPDTSVEAALELLSTARPESAFQWHPVTRQMSNVKYQAPNTSHVAANYTYYAMVLMIFYLLTTGDSLP